jgi:hypothetical protein
MTDQLQTILDNRPMIDHLTNTTWIYLVAMYVQVPAGTLDANRYRAELEHNHDTAWETLALLVSAEDMKVIQAVVEKNIRRNEFIAGTGMPKWALEMNMTFNHGSH